MDEETKPQCRKKSISTSDELSIRREAMRRIEKNQEQLEEVREMIRRVRLSAEFAFCLSGGTELPRRLTLSTADLGPDTFEQVALGTLSTLDGMIGSRIEGDLEFLGVEESDAVAMVRLIGRKEIEEGEN